MKRTNNLDYYTRGASKDAWEDEILFLVYLFYFSIYYFVNAIFVMEDIFINFINLYYLDIFVN